MKKILFSLLTISAVAAVAFYGTRAFFFDTETSTGNTFTAGSVDLKVDAQARYNGLICVPNTTTTENITDYWWQFENPSNSSNDSYIQSLVGDPCTNSWESTDLDPSYKFFDLGDLKPGDRGGNTISLKVVNNDAYMCAGISKTDEENQLAEPETAMSDTDPDGDLGKYLHFAWYIDANHNNMRDLGEGVLFGGPVTMDEMYTSPYSVVDAGGNLLLTLADTKPHNVFSNTNNGPITGDVTNYIGVEWCFGDMQLGANGGFTCTGAGNQNDAMTDKITATLSFYAEQARNNDTFLCPEHQPKPVAVLGTGWSAHNNQQDFFAKARANNTNNFEVALGTNDAAAGGQTTAQATWVDNTPYPFTLTYDGLGNAQFTINSQVLNFTVSDPTANRIGINAKAAISGTTTTVSDIQLNSMSPAVNSVTANNAHNHLLITGLDLTGGFTLTGNLTVEWNDFANPNEANAMQIIVD